MKKIFTLNSMKRILAVLTVVLAAATQSNAQLVINEIDYDQPERILQNMLNFIMQAQAQ